MKKSRKFTVCLLVVLAAIFMVLPGCQRESDRVSHNLSLEADNFNVARKLTVINQRTDTILFQMTGNFSVGNDSDGDLDIIGENKDGTYYKHFVRMSSEITYIVEDLGTTKTNKYQYQINFNPNMIIPVQPTEID